MPSFFESPEELPLEHLWMPSSIILKLLPESNIGSSGSLLKIFILFDIFAAFSIVSGLLYSQV